MLGFARISSLRRSAGTVFLENRCARSGMPDYFGKYLPVGEGEEESVLSPQDKEVLSLCFSYVSTENRPAYGEMLLGFPDEVIDRLSAELGLTDMEDANLYVNKSRLRDFCGRVLDRCKSRRVTPVELFGSWEKIGTAALEEMENADRLERERKTQENLATAKKAVAEWQAELKEVLPKGPQDYPMDFTVGQVEEKDVIAINKWLHDVLGIGNVSVEMRFMGPRQMWVSGPDEKDDKESSDRKFRNSLFGFDEHEPGNRYRKIRRIEFNHTTTVRQAFEEFFSFQKIRRSAVTEVPA